MSSSSTCTAASLSSLSKCLAPLTGNKTSKKLINPRQVFLLSLIPKTNCHSCQFFVVLNRFAGFFNRLIRQSGFPLVRRCRSLARLFFIFLVPSSTTFVNGGRDFNLRLMIHHSNDLFCCFATSSKRAVEEFRSLDVGSIMSSPVVCFFAPPLVQG